MSEVVSVWLPAVLSVTVKFLVPAANAALAGNVAPVSLEVIPVVSITVLTRFQLVSTALTVAVNAVPAVCAVGVPVLPVAVPGTAVSPGTNSCSFTDAPALTVTPALVLAVKAAAASVAVTVRVPAVLKVKLDKVAVPATSVMFPAVALLSSALIAFVSVLLMVTLGTALGTMFQLASTALTTMPLVIAIAAVCAVGVAAVLPVAVPGAATSPGSRICSLVTAPGLTVMGGLVLEVLPPSLMFVAVTVQLPTVLKLTEKVLVPEASAALAGCVSFGSVVVMPMVLAGAALTRLQLASTALTVTVKGVPAV